MSRRDIFVSSLFFLVWAVLFFVLQSLHIPWRDEFQPWLIVVHTESWSEFFHAIWYERQAPLQYLFLSAANKILGSYFSPLFIVRLVSDVFTVGMVGLIFFCYRLPRLARLLIPFSIFFFREYGVIARNYPIGVFFLLLAVLMFERKFEWAVLGCLIVAALTHLYFTWMSACLALIFYFIYQPRGQRRYASLAAVWAVCLAVVIFLRPPPGSPFSAEFSLFSWGAFFEIFKTLARAFTGLGRFYGLGFDFSWPRDGWIVLPAIALIIAYIRAAMRGGVSSWRFWLLAAFPLFVSATTYNPDTRHAGTIFTALIIAWILSPRQKADLMNLVAIVAVVSTMIWLYAWKPYLPTPNMNHSGARDFLNKYEEPLKNQEMKILTDADKYFFAPMGMAGFSIFDVRRNREVLYPYYNDLEYKYSLETWCREFAAAFFDQWSPKKAIYFGLSKGSQPPKSCGCVRLDFETPHPAITDEVSVFRWISPAECGLTNR